MLVLAVAVGLTAVASEAHGGHVSDAWVVDYDANYGADNPWNGYRVFLSSPRHKDSGHRGECWNPGRQENANGRKFAVYAATGLWYQERIQSESPWRSLRTRRYEVVVSRASMDNGYRDNRLRSERWGADVHIVVHSNASGGCPTANNYLLTMYRNDGSWRRPYQERLSAQLRTRIDPVSPGGTQHWSAGFHELFHPAPHTSYLELQFHDNPSTQAWMNDDSYKSGWRVGYAVDKHFGYPRTY